MIYIFKNKRIIGLIGLTALVFILLIGCNKWIESSTQHQLYSNIDSIPYRKVGLVLGANQKQVPEKPIYISYTE